jgi:hypothetical protein
MPRSGEGWVLLRPGESPPEEQPVLPWTDDTESDEVPAEALSSADVADDTPAQTSATLPAAEQEPAKTPEALPAEAAAAGGGSLDSPSVDAAAADQHRSNPAWAEPDAAAGIANEESVAAQAPDEQAASDSRRAPLVHTPQGGADGAFTQDGDLGNNSTAGPADGPGVPAVPADAVSPGGAVVEPAGRGVR